MLRFLFACGGIIVLFCLWRSFELRPFRVRPGWLAAAAVLGWTAVVGTLQYTPNPAEAFHDMAEGGALFLLDRLVNFLLRRRREKKRARQRAEG